MSASEPNTAAPVIELTAEDVTRNEQMSSAHEEATADQAAGPQPSSRKLQQRRLVLAALAAAFVLVLAAAGYLSFGDRLVRRDDQIAALAARLATLEEANGTAREALEQLKATTAALADQLGGINAQAEQLTKLAQDQAKLAARVTAMDEALAALGQTGAEAASASASRASAPADALPPVISPAARALKELTAAYQAGGDVLDPLGALSSAAPDLAGVQELKAAIALGVPQQAALLAAADQALAQASPAAPREAAPTPGWLGFLKTKLAAVVKITPAAQLAAVQHVTRARALIAAGDYAGAAAVLAAPDEAPELSGLLSRRIAADRALATVTASALSSIAGGA